MKASELIVYLQDMINNEGDREVFYYGENPAIDRPAFKRKVKLILSTVNREFIIR